MLLLGWYVGAGHADALWLRGISGLSVVVHSYLTSKFESKVASVEQCMYTGIAPSGLCLFIDQICMGALVIFSLTRFI